MTKISLEESIKRYKEIVRMAKQRYSLSSIALKYSVTRQRVHQIINKGVPYKKISATGIPSGISNKEYQRLYRKTIHHKVRATKIVYTNLRNGNLKKNKCFCGNKKVEGHHEDYNKPLDIVWLCKKHHVQADKLRRTREILIHR